MSSIPTTPLRGHLPGEPLVASTAGPQDGAVANSAWGRPPMRQMAPIIVIDDSLAVRRVVESSFERVGIPTVTYPDGIAAINALLNLEEYTPALILLDIGLPKMSGYEVAELLRQHPRFEKTMLVMLSGRDGMVNRWRSKLVGARDFIAKPFKPADLVARVCRLLEIDVAAPARQPHRHPLAGSSHG